MSQAAATAPAERIEEMMIRSAHSNHQRLPVLEVIFDRFALALGPVMKSYCHGVTSEAELVSFSYMSVGEAQDSISPHGLALGINVGPWNGLIGMVIDPKLLFTTMEIMLGGRESSRGLWTPRAFSAIEKRLGQRLCEAVLGELVDTFSQVADLYFEVERTEGSPQALVLAAPNAPCAKIEMKISFEDRGGLLTFLLPHTALEDIRGILAEPFQGGQLGGDSSWRELLTLTLQDTDVTVDAVLHEPHVKLSDVLAWKPGQVIDLGIEQDQEVKVSCSTLDMFSAAVGRRRNGKVALRVTRDFSEKEDLTDVAFD
ncbi:MAG: hypothetical protein CML02_20330 [Pseudooceanicola sp.]|nr:hypothetical protein [Pseudooceanicola sp.]|tara:strand:+ start:1059 stop:2000 length:942 start_codon:yes stop_codon:yes gene_type:complete